MIIPVYIISGFLGSGKTTFLNHLFSQLTDDLKVAVIVNELGDIAIDGKIIEKEDYLLKEITQGCVCCTLRAELAGALLSIVDEQTPDLIIIETTGVARPKQITSVFDFKKVAEKVSPNGTVCFLDASLYMKVGHNLPIINYQIEESDVIIINKVDLLEEEQISVLRERLKDFTGDDKAVYETIFSTIAYERIFPGMKDLSLTKGNALNDLKGKDHEMDHIHNTEEHHDHFDSTADFGTLSIKSQKVWSLDKIEKLLSDHEDKIIRAKGLLITHKGNKLVQLSTSGIEIEDYSESIPQSELVIIFKEEDRTTLETGFNQLI
jgi:G3E family GTPase